MGLNSGLVVVGSIGDNLRMDYSAIGDTTYLASRLQGKRNEARELLEPVYSWFTEGFDTANLIDAKTLLDELTEGSS